MANLSAATQTEVCKDSVACASLPDSSPQRELAALELENEELRLTLLQTETLMRETNHRVKNNLQMVSSLLRMQAELLKDRHAVAALQSTQHRVLSMAMIHERLCGDLRIDVIDFEDYTRMLLKELFDSFGMRGGRVSISLDCSKLFLKVEQAIPCSLILNELITNALKYAFPGTRKGKVTVALKESRSGFVTIRVADDGVGLPDGFDWKESTSMGLPIVDLLAQQLAGKVTVRTGPGTEFKIEFQQ